MPDDFGLVNLVVSPFLERIGREEKLGDQPRKPKNLKAGPVRKDNGGTQPDVSQKTDDDSTSSQHIDLRI
jgi:hypothetical protein